MLEKCSSIIFLCKFTFVAMSCLFSFELDLSLAGMYVLLNAFSVGLAGYVSAVCDHLCVYLLLAIWFHDGVQAHCRCRSANLPGRVMAKVPGTSAGTCFRGLALEGSEQ